MDANILVEGLVPLGTLVSRPCGTEGAHTGLLQSPLSISPRDGGSCLQNTFLHKDANIWNDGRQRIGCCSLFGHPIVPGHFNEKHQALHINVSKTLAIMLVQASKKMAHEENQNLFWS